MHHLDAVDALGHLHDQPVHIGVGAAVPGDLGHHQRAHAAEGGQIEPLRLVEQRIRHLVGEAAAEVAPAFMLLFGVTGIDHVPMAEPGVVVQLHHLLRRVLQVVVHGDDIGAAGMPQPGHDRIMLAVVPRVLDIGHRDRRRRSQGAADIAGIVRAAVVHQHHFQSAGGFQRRQRLDQPANGGGAAIDRHDDRKPHGMWGRLLGQYQGHSAVLEFR